MTRRNHRVIVTVLMSVLLAACQPVGPQATIPDAAGVPTVSVGVANGSTITVRLSALAGLRTTALPRAANSVNNYSVTLHDNGTNVQVGVPLIINGPATTGNFTLVPVGSYYIKANAFAGPGQTNSIVIGGVAIQSLNTVTIATGTATYTNVSGSGTTHLVVNLPLLDGTPGTGTSNISVAGRTSALATADKSGVSLVNNGSRRSIANPVNASITYQLSTVQEGLNSATASSHDVWAFSVDTGAGLASMPASTVGGASATGVIAAVYNVNLAARTLETPVAAAQTIAGPLHVNSLNDVFFLSGTDIKRAAAGTPFVVTTAVAAGAAVTGWTVGPNFAGAYFSTGTDIRSSVLSGGIWQPSTVARSATNVGIIATDEARNLYWYDTVTGKVRRSTFDGTAYGTAYDIATPGIAVTAMATDAYGNLFYTTGTDVKRVVLGTDEATYQPSNPAAISPVPLIGQPALAGTTVATAAGITSLDVDRAGNIYFSDASHFVKFVGAGETTIYKLAGNGTATGADSLTGATPLATALESPNRVAVTVSGQLYLTSLGSLGGGSLTYLRRIP
ncbi:MAG: hypothetical protein H7338_10795 [Candidatus Sericytochromatia bacterium]|nr:hypothetical protein [Candidatus Sericytochromatia bacterium]